MRLWVRYSRGRVTYTGRISRGPFIAWADTPEGRRVVDRLASTIRFSLVGKRRAAQRRLWRQLLAMARDETIVAAVQHEAQAYLERLSGFAYADGLPRVGVNLHRLVVVPRVLLNGAAFRGFLDQLNACSAFATVEGGAALREFFILTLIEHLDGVVESARPTPNRPLPAGESWMTVGMNNPFVWRIPLLNSPPWNGHHYVLEMTRDPVTRRLRKAVTDSVQRLEESLTTLSRDARDDIMRRATRPGSDDYTTDIRKRISSSISSGVDTVSAISARRT